MVRLSSDVSCRAHISFHGFLECPLAGQAPVYRMVDLAVVSKHDKLLTHRSLAKKNNSAIVVAMLALFAGRLVSVGLDFDFH